MPVAAAILCAAEAATRVFSPFEQVDGSIRRRFGGSGLGLPISKHFVELHGGRIWFESEEGQGSTFYFTLPIDPPADDEGVARWFSPYQQYEERARPTRAPAPVVRPRFLVLETGGALQRLLTRYLSDAEITRVDTLQDAVRELARTPAQALLMNDLSVSQALEQLSESGGMPDGTPALVCSVPGIHEAAATLGVTDYLVKPIMREALLSALDRLEPPVQTLLVIDDEPDALRLFRRLLLGSGRGYRILKASDGQEALDILHAHPVDAILLDLVMPTMDGFQFLAHKSQDVALREIPTIAISARDPGGQPIVSNALAVERAGGISLPQLVACIEALSQILSPGGPTHAPASAGTSSD